VISLLAGLNNQAIERALKTFFCTYKNWGWLSLNNQATEQALKTFLKDDRGDVRWLGSQ